MSNEIKPLALHGHTRAVTHIRYTNEGDIIFSSGKDGLVCAWRTTDGERIGVYEGHSAIAGFSINQTSTLLATAGSDLKTILYNVENGSTLSKIEHLAPCRSTGISYDDSILFCNTDKKMGQPGAIHFYNLPESIGLGVAPKTRFNPFASFTLPNEAITYAEFGPTQSTIFYTMGKGAVGILDVERQTAIRTARPHSEEHDVVKMHFDSNYMTCITASKDCSAKLLDPRSLSTIQTYKMDLPCNDATISPTADHVIIGGGIDAQEAALSAHGGFSLRFYHKVHEDLLGTMSVHFGTIYGISFNPSGTGFASAAADGFVKLFTFGEGYSKTVGATPLWVPKSDEDEDNGAEEGEEEEYDEEGYVEEEEEEEAPAAAAAEDVDESA